MSQHALRGDDIDTRFDVEAVLDDIDEEQDQQALRRSWRQYLVHSVHGFDPGDGIPGCKSGAGPLLVDVGMIAVRGALRTAGQVDGKAPWDADREAGSRTDLA